MNSSVSVNSLIPSTYATCSNTFIAGQPNGTDRAQKILHTNLSPPPNQWPLGNLSNPGHKNMCLQQYLPRPSIQSSIHLDRAQDLQRIPTQRCSVASVTDKQILPLAGLYRTVITEPIGSTNWANGTPSYRVGLGKPALQHNRILTTRNTNNRIFTTPTEQCQLVIVFIPNPGGGIATIPGNIIVRIPNVFRQALALQPQQDGVQIRFSQGSALINIADNTTDPGLLSLHTLDTDNIWQPDTFGGAIPSGILSGNIPAAILNSQKDLIVLTEVRTSGTAVSVIKNGSTSPITIQQTSDPTERLGESLSIIGDSNNNTIFIGSPGTNTSGVVLISENLSTPIPINMSVIVSPDYRVVKLEGVSQDEVLVTLMKNDGTGGQLIQLNKGTSWGSFSANIVDIVDALGYGSALTVELVGTTLIAAVSAPGDKKIVIYIRNNINNTWEKKFEINNPQVGDSFGHSIALTTKGLLIVGEPTNNRVHVYTVLGELIQSWTAPAGYSEAGVSVSVSGNNLSVAANITDASGIKSGIVLSALILE